MKGAYKEAQSEAFSILAGYIFGKNETKQKISMTAPVTQEAPPTSEKISMTAPVMQESSGDSWVMSFMMPSKYTIANLPIPIDKRVTFEKITPKLVAVIRYSWGRGTDRNKKKADELLLWLKSQPGYQPVLTPKSAGYDPPWTLPFLRRNEMLVDLEIVTLSPNPN